MNYTFTSRPSNSLWLSARFWTYDFDNRTPLFHVNQTVTYDTSVSTFPPGTTSPYTLNRKAFDAEVSYTPWKSSAIPRRLTRSDINQTFRYIDSTEKTSCACRGTHEAGLADGARRLRTLEGRRLRVRRPGAGRHRRAGLARQFDVSDGTADRVSLLLQVTPMSSLSFHGTIAAGNEDRPETSPTGVNGAPESAFGLLSNDNHSYSLGADYVPRPGRLVRRRVCLGAVQRRCRSPGRRTRVRNSTTAGATGRRTAPTRRTRSPRRWTC